MSSDSRSVLVLVEPRWSADGLTWHGMAFAGGEVINDVTGADRAEILEDCLAALGGAITEDQT
jgi:hypothetical protein